MSDSLFDATACAHAHLEAWVQHAPVSERHQHFTPPDLDAVYQVHAAMAEDPLSLELGGLAGYKQGGIGAAPQSDGQPAPAVYGPIFGKYIMPETSAHLSKEQLQLFGLEAEIGFRMRATPAPSEEDELTEQDVWAAVGEVFLAVEVVGRRHTIKDATSLECLGDASCAAAVVCGKSWSVDDDDCPTPQDLMNVTTQILVNDELKSEGPATKNPLGSPLASLHWCGLHLVSRGMCLQAGETVIAGACCKTRDWQPSDHIVVTFGALGTVELQIDP